MEKGHHESRVQFSFREPRGSLQAFVLGGEGLFSYFGEVVGAVIGNL
jgi:hypothetical protein